jgi:putative N6-adenine-specific DNA methylase
MANLFAVCAPGLEPFTAQELAQLGLARQASSGKEEGGVSFEGDLPEIYRANLNLRTASRVLVRLGEFVAVGFPELRRKVHNLIWERYLIPGRPVTLRVTSHASKLYVKRAIARHVAEGIGERIGNLPSLSPSVPLSPLDDTLEIPEISTGGDEEMEERGQLVVVRILHDLCTISVDSSGELLHRRGYRLATARAPLRETLAAGVLLASGWDTASPLLDPFCGSGTIPIEAALLGLRIAPGRARRFQFMDWPGFYYLTWQAILQDADSCRASTIPPILGSDRDAGAIAMAQANAARAGVAEYVEFSRRAVSGIEFKFGERSPGLGWVVTNPPYGIRVSGQREGKDLRDLYAQFGNVLRTQCPGWRVAMLCADDRLLSCTGLKFEKRISLVNGGVHVKLAKGRV